ncbi:MAG TPA: hypothetical protein VEC12_15030 [Bacteroidia bacterium]|nr:hypothetical protein [Bacteroidia bacterium]
MSPLLKKLNYKNQPQVVLLNLPEEQKHLIADFGESAKVFTDAKKVEKVHFLVAFCTQQAEVDMVAAQVLPKIEGDGVVWLVYPKGTSKRYKCEFNRDTGWQSVGAQGFEGVRIVAVDEDWSALRFRRAENIKTMTRSFAMTKEGKEKAGKKK